MTSLRRSVVRSFVVAAMLAAGVRPAAAQWSGSCERGERKATQAVVAGAFVGGNVALYEYFRRAWWSGDKADKFRINWERNEPFRQADKFGHALGGYHLARASSDLLEVACVRSRRAAVWGAAYAAAFQLQIEIWDAKQAKYGFSPPDLIANTTGAAYAVVQQAYPKLRHVKPTFSYAASRAYKRRAQFKPYDVGAELRPTLDYSGQTYWMSANMHELLPEGARHFWPAPLRLSVGHSITDWVSPQTGGAQFARHELVLSVDIDPEQLPGENRVWKRVKHELSYYHFPAPALVLAPTLHGAKWYR